MGFAGKAPSGGDRKGRPASASGAREPAKEGVRLGAIRLDRKPAGSESQGERGVAATARSSAPAIPAVVGPVLRSPGSPLDAATRTVMETQFNHDFGRVRVHTDERADASARAVHAIAYTVGQDIVFREGTFAPTTTAGRRLLAHELTHVVQQSHPIATPAAGATPSVVRERVASPIVARANATETAGVLKQGTVATSGVQFWPLTLTSTRIGPVSAPGGAVNDRRNRLSVLVGQGMTIKHMADLILPLWNSATPFTAPGAQGPASSAPLTADELARGLLFYNQTYLFVVSSPTPSMTGFSAGLRFPLPVDIDASGEGVVNADTIRNAAGSFDATLAPLLDQPAGAASVLGGADLTKSVSDFLAASPDRDARGMELATRSVKNPLEAWPFVKEAFNQVGAGQFDLALAMMDWLVNVQVPLLASQRHGAAILDAVRAALAAAPANPSPRQQESLARANVMLGQTAGVAARAPTSVPEKVDFTKYAGGGDVAGWVSAALSVLGLPDNKDWHTGYETLCYRESGNDPNQVNTWDSNATGPRQVDGAPANSSRGLTQVIPGTFSARHAAGTPWAIYDPVANIAASINYVMDKYHVAQDGSDLARKVQQADPNRSPQGY